MRTLLNGLRRVSPKYASNRRRKYRPILESLEDRCLLDAGYLQTNLVSSVPGLAINTDSNLKNPWGIVTPPGGPFWVSDNNTGVSTLYNSPGQNQGLVVTIPASATQAQGPTGSPTGVVFNGTGQFVVSQNGNSGSAFFIFATEDGTIAGWNPSVNLFNAVTAWDEGSATIDWTGMALANNGSGNFLYIADNGNGGIRVFDSNFNPATLAGSFTDPNLPAGYKPYNVASLNGNLYVTYDNPSLGPKLGNGLIDRFDTNGNFIGRLVTGGNLDQPWGLAMAPGEFGPFANKLIVGNKGDGHINAYMPLNGDPMGQMTDAGGNPITIPGLWGLTFGNAGDGGDEDTLFFTAGINGYQDGLLGSLQPNNHPVPFHTVQQTVIPNLQSSPALNVSNVPPNGDSNPYGIAYVPAGFATGGVLNPGDLLVSNFNSSSGLQGTGTTVMRITPNGQSSVFFTAPAGSGLTTALGVLKSGYVLVGNVPTTDGHFDTIQQGSLYIVDSNGNLVNTLTDSTFLDGPWDLTINDQGSTAQVFVSNVLNGTVSRLDLLTPTGVTPSVVGMVTVASGYSVIPNDAAVVLGVTGLAYDAQRGNLFIASTGDNAIYEVGSAGTRTSSPGVGHLVYSDTAHLRGPLGLVLTPNGDLITANGDAVNADPTQPSELVEFTQQGGFVSQVSIDPNTGGAFGVALVQVKPNDELKFAAVEDNTASDLVWKIDMMEGAPLGVPTRPSKLAALSRSLDLHAPTVPDLSAGTGTSSLTSPHSPALSSAVQELGLLLASQPTPTSAGAHRHAVDLSFADSDADLFEV